MIGRNVLIQIILTLLGSLIGFLSLSLSARFFGPNILGHLAYVLALTGIVFAFSDLGFSQAHIHFTAALNSAKKTLGTFLRLKLILLVVAGAIGLFIASLDPGQFKGIFVIVLLYEMISRFSEAVFITFEGLQQSIPQNVSRLIAKIVKLTAVIILGLKLTNVFGYSLTFLIEGLVLMILSFWLIRHLFPLTFSSKLAKKYLIYSLPFFVIVPISYLQTNIITILLKSFHSAKEVGYYAASVNLTGYIKTLFGAIMIYFFPKISSLFQKQDLKSIQNYANLSLKYLLIIFIPIFIFSFLLRREIILFILGQEFLPAIPAFNLLLLGMFILMLVNPYSYILYATKKHKSLIKVNLVGLLLTVILSFYFMSQSGGLGLGSTGAVLVSLITWFITGVWSLILVKKQLNISFFPKVFHFLFPAVLLGGFANLIFTYFQTGLLIKLSGSVLAVLIYLLYLFIFKLLKLTDIEYFVNLLWTKHSKF